MKIIAKILILLCFTLQTSVATAREYIDKRDDQAWNNKSGDLYVLGQGVYDIVVKFESRKKLEEYISRFGMQIGQGRLIDGSVAKKVLQELRPFYEGAGGSASNTIAGFASLGGKTAFVGVLAEDKTGLTYANDMKGYGVSTHIKYKAGENDTGIIIVLLAPDGERTMLAYPGISKEIQESDVDYKELSNYKVFLTEGYLWDHPGNDEIIRNINSIAKGLGVHTAFTFGDTYIVQKHREDFLKLISEVDIVLSDESQILALFATKDLDCAVQETQKLANLAIITLGARGAMIVTPEEIINISALDIKHIVDTTGAGDQFAAGFLYGYTRGYGLKCAGDLGTKAAAYILQQFGAKPKKRLTELLTNTNKAID